MKRIEILIPGDKLREAREAVIKLGAGGFLAISGKGQGKGERPSVGGGRGTSRHIAEYNPIESIMTVVDDSKVSAIVNAVLEATSTGSSGDGKIFVTTVEDAYDIGTKQKGTSAI